MKEIDSYISTILGVVGFGFTAFFICAFGAAVVSKFITAYFPKDPTARMQAMLCVTMFMSGLSLVLIMFFGFMGWLGTF